MPLTDNTFTNTLGDFDANNGGNWSLGHVPTSSERAIITATVQGQTVNFTDITIGALKIDDNDGSGDPTDGGGSYGSVPPGSPTVLGLLEIDNLASGGDGVDVIAQGDVLAVNCSGSSTGLWGYGTARTITVNGGTFILNGGNPPVPADYTIVSQNGGVIYGITMLPGNAYAALTQSTGKIGDTIGGTYDNASWGFTPQAATCGGHALTNFTASAGAWSGKIAAGTPSGSQTVSLINNTNAQTLGAGTIALGATPHGRTCVGIGLGIGF